MPNTYGRQVVLPLTNKSGAGVIAGDVVVVDTTNNDAFTTSAAGNVTSMVGIAQDTIANNATGRVLVSGYAALVNVNASVTRGHYGATYTVAKQATDAGTSRVLGTCMIFLTGGTTPDAHLFGAVDLGTGSGNYTSAITWSSGTSMPGSPATNQRITRTDLGLDFYYDGTRWVSVILFRDTIGQGENTMPATASTSSLGKLPAFATTFDLWLDAFYSMTYIATTNNGTNFWTVDCFKTDAAAANTSVAQFTTAADTVNNWTQRRVAIGAAYVAASYRGFVVASTKTLSPGAIYWAFALTYRLIGT